MNRNVIMATAAFGGLLLITALLTNTDEENLISENNNEITAQEEATSAKEAQENLAISFPFYPSAKIISVKETKGDDGRTFYSHTLETNDSIKDINEWYRDAFSINGWNVKSDKNIAGYQLIQAENNNLYSSIQAANGDAPGSVRISQQSQIRP